MYTKRRNSLQTQKYVSKYSFRKKVSLEESMSHYLPKMLKIFIPFWCLFALEITVVTVHRSLRNQTQVCSKLNHGYKWKAVLSKSSWNTTVLQILIGKEASSFPNGISISITFIFQKEAEKEGVQQAKFC